jgi:hypothetical protein
MGQAMVADFVPFSSNILPGGHAFQPLLATGTQQVEGSPQPQIVHGWYRFLNLILYPIIKG